MEYEHEAAATSGELEPREIEFIRVYLVNGMNGSKAATEVYGLDGSAASNKAHSLLHDPRIAAVVAAEMHSRMQRLRIDSDWVLEQAVEVFNRCMQVEKLLDRNGNLTGEFKFDAANSLKALDIIGKHINVKAFEEAQHNHRQEEIVQRLLRGRGRSRIAQQSIIQALANSQGGDAPSFF